MVTETRKNFACRLGVVLSPTCPDVMKRVYSTCEAVGYTYVTALGV